MGGCLNRGFSRGIGVENPSHKGFLGVLWFLGRMSGFRGKIGEGWNEDVGFRFALPDLQTKERAMNRSGLKTPPTRGNRG